MGFRFYRSVRLGRGLRLNLSKTGVGVSAGVPGLRYSIHSSGRTVRTAGLPGTGLYYRKDSSVGRSGRSGRSARAALRMPASPRVQMHPKASLFARKEDKLFVRGVTAYMQGRHEDALAALREVIGRDPANAHVGEEVFAGMALVELGRNADAIPMLEAVVASDQQIPDALMTKYRLSGQMVVAVTPAVTATVPMSHVSAALMLAELYQRAGRPQAAVELLESLGSLAPDPVFALSLAELYAAMERPDDVLRVTEGFVQNRDDATA
ncbi:MAG TPA: DUF4236 domain-containing protein, partial [Actinomycetota bacterium]|nr:DUF4236 domain-containing protein [Actinomycetota bacterium]